MEWSSSSVLRLSSCSLHCSFRRLFVVSSNFSTSRRSAFRACVMRIRSRVASWMGISLRYSPLELRSSMSITLGEHRKRILSVSGTKTICPLSLMDVSSKLKTMDSLLALGSHLDMDSRLWLAVSGIRGVMDSRLWLAELTKRGDLSQNSSDGSITPGRVPDDEHSTQVVQYRIKTHHIISNNWTDYFKQILEAVTLFVVFSYFLLARF